MRPIAATDTVIAIVTVVAVTIAAPIRIAAMIKRRRAIIVAIESRRRKCRFVICAHLVAKVRLGAGATAAETGAGFPPSGAAIAATTTHSTATATHAPATPIATATSITTIASATHTVATAATAGDRGEAAAQRDLIGFEARLFGDDAYQAVLDHGQARLCVREIPNGHAWDTH